MGFFTGDITSTTTPTQGTTITSVRAETPVDARGSPEPRLPIGDLTTPTATVRDAMTTQIGTNE